MELEIYRALTKVNVSPEDAQRVAESINKEIDRRYELHAKQLATRGDIADLKSDMNSTKTELIKWTVSTMFGAVAMFAAVTKLLH